MKLRLTTPERVKEVPRSSFHIHDVYFSRLAREDLSPLTIDPSEVFGAQEPLYAATVNFR